MNKIIGKNTEADKLLLKFLQRDPIQVENTCIALRVKLKDIIPIHESQLHKLPFNEGIFEKLEEIRHKTVLRVLHALANRPVRNAHTTSPCKRETAHKVEKKPSRVPGNIDKLKQDREAWVNMKNQEFEDKAKKVEEIRHGNKLRRERYFKNKHENFNKVIANRKKLEEEEEVKMAKKLEKLLSRSEAKIRNDKKKVKFIIKEDEEQDIARRLEIYNKKIQNQTTLHGEKIFERVVHAKEHSTIVGEKYKQSVIQQGENSELALRKSISKAILLKERKMSRERIIRNYSLKMKNLSKSLPKGEETAIVTGSSEIFNDSLCLTRPPLNYQTIDKNKQLKLIKMIKHCRNYSLNFQKDMILKKKLLEKHKKIQPNFLLS